MRKERDIAKSLSIIEKKEKYDACCKRVLANKEILAWILKSCVKEFEDCEIEDIRDKYINGDPLISEIAVHRDEDVPERIGNVSVEDSSINEGSVFYDIRFEAFAPHEGENIKLIINLEAQNDFYPGYPIVKRGIYYCSRLISAQYGTEFTSSDYGAMKKVYSIWICTRPPEYLADTINRFKIVHVGEENIHLKSEDYEVMEVIILGIGKDYDRDKDNIFKLLDLIFSSTETSAEKKEILESDFNMKMTRKEESEVERMCNVSEGIWEEALEQGMLKGIGQGMLKGMEQGMEQGVLKGMEQGMEQGVLKGKLESINSLMNSMNLSLEEAMKILNVPEEEREKFRELVIA